MNGVMDYNWLGVAFVSDDLPKKTHSLVEKHMDALYDNANRDFDRWLDEHGLERVMGVIVAKGSVK